MWMKSRDSKRGSLRTYLPLHQISFLYSIKHYHVCYDRIMYLEASAASALMILIDIFGQAKKDA